MVTQAINNRTLEGHGYSPAQIMFGFQPRYSESTSIEEHVLAQEVEVNSVPPTEQKWTQAWETYQGTREESRGRIQSPLQARSTLDHPPGRLKLGDLVLLRQVELDGAHGRKLEARWKGPFIVSKVYAGQASVDLSDLLSNLPIGKYHVNHVKLFRTRTQFQKEEAAEVAFQTKLHHEHLSELLRESRRRGER
ncbi:hypothetical protein N7449_009558 [Penicillium cf. viridicatum]|uniref:Uncharacterized protein n=1 Tax=Penicillium cf. viridicatum TaxID=2972119 RepID=A0A9W9JCG2_9EURO|nr:hypothetical protein N7449_009558 [Penicillium cf. viridicatum]